MNISPMFPGLSAYGNYLENEVPPEMHTIPTDGTIREVKRLGIPYVEVVAMDQVGRNYYPRRVSYAIRHGDRPRLEQAAAYRDAQRTARRPAPHPDLLLCIREASRAAHRERDAAQEAYLNHRYLAAGTHRKGKDRWYSLKDRGIVAAHRLRLLRYIGAAPQGMAVYQYGEHDMACLHSTLHPVGAERTVVRGHPETLRVQAKGKVRGISLDRVEVTLSALPEDLDGYERSAAPRMECRSVTCWRCGEEGHISRDCPDRDDDYDVYPDGTPMVNS